MGDLNYTSVDRIFSKINRDIKGTEINETDVIEWIGESLEFLKVPQILVEEVKFLKVRDYHCEIPENLHLITQIAKNRDLPKRERFVPEIRCDKINHYEGCGCVTEELEITPFSKICNSEGPLDNLPDDYALAFLNMEEAQMLETETLQTLDLDWNYGNWTMSNYYHTNFTPVRLTTHTFFNSLVCKEKYQGIYDNCDYEYTIIGDVEKRLRFNFKEGEVAISYLKNSVDKDTGYPLIPDDISYISAMVYYIKWKIAESNEWAGREGWSGKAEKSEERWLKYARQAKNNMKMPKTLDQYQNLLEQSHYLIPNHKKYYNYFGNLGKSEQLNYKTYNRTIQ